MMQSKKEIGRRLMIRRTKLRMSRSRLAYKLGVCESTIRNWEKGYTSIPDDKKSEIAKNLGFNEEELYYVPVKTSQGTDEQWDIIIEYMQRKLAEFKKNDNEITNGKRSDSK